jgi:hypothetical protein
MTFITAYCTNIENQYSVTLDIGEVNLTRPYSKEKAERSSHVGKKKKLKTKTKN